MVTKGVDRWVAQSKILKDLADWLKSGDPDALSLMVIVTQLRDNSNLPKMTAAEAFRKNGQVKHFLRLSNDGY